MKVLLLVTEDWYFRSHRLDLARRLRDAGNTVCVGTRLNQDARWLEQEGFEVYPLPFERSLRKPWQDFRSYREIKRLVARIKPDIVHLVAQKPAFLGGLALRGNDRVAVLTAFAGLGYLFSSNDRTARCLRPLITQVLRRLLRKSNQWVLSQNPDDRDLLLGLKLGDAARHAVIGGSGIDTTKYAAMPLAREASAATQIRVLFVARLLRDKGINELVEAARALQRSHPQVRVVLAGACDPDNPSSIKSDEVESWVAQGLVEWLGHCSTMVTVYADADIVCLPSYREGLPKVLLEGAACARPLIATDVPGCREICQHGVTGLLVAAKDARALAAAIGELADDASRSRAMGKAGCELVSRAYSLTHISEQTMALYERMISAAEPASPAPGEM